ncbi:hypothetical protein A9Q83_04795 [Alphaproteobacteria bacterium 46_93_T64]|nr:hypothetical protein A9Q83_04795 [Alphaproteobacteria bacterium 46_93_T64]
MATVVKFGFFILLLCVISIASLDNVSARPVCNADEQVSLASEDAFFPYSGKYNGKMRGYSYDLVRAAFAAVGCKLEVTSSSYNRCMVEVAMGKLLGCFNTTNSHENRTKYILHKRPLFYGRIQVFARADHQGKFEEKSYYNSRFAVVRGYQYSFEFDSDTAIEKVEVDSDLQTLALVSVKRADYALVYDMVAQFHLTRKNNLIKERPIPIGLHAEYGLYVSFSRARGSQAQRIADILDHGLSRINVSGEYRRIENRWMKWLSSGKENDLPAPYWQDPN